VGGSVLLFPVSLTADVIDYDSSQTRLRREASYLGASTFVERTATSTAPLILVVLRLLGDRLGLRLAGERMPHEDIPDREFEIGSASQRFFCSPLRAGCSIPP
jgi:hypothetical protein